MLSALFEWLLRFRLFSRSERVDGRWKIIVWWEFRRIPYNLIVAASGLISGTVALGFEFAAENVTGESFLPDSPLFVAFFIAAYAIMANICFMLGWVIELLAQHIWHERAEHIGEISFALGTVFSVMLTLMLGFMVAIGDVAVILKHIYFH